MESMPSYHEGGIEGQKSCIAYTYAARSRLFTPHDLGPFCTTRYLAEEFTAGCTKHLASIDTVLEETIQDILARGELTEADRVQAQVAEEEAYETFGQRVISLADNTGLSREIDPQTAYELIDFPVVSSGEDLVREFTEPQTMRSWMLPRLWGGDGFNLLLLLPQKADGQISTFRVAELDAIYKANPAALKGLIRDYHEQCAVNTLIADLTDALALHEAAIEGMPEYINQLAKLEETQRSQEITAIGNFITWTALLGGDRDIILGWLGRLPTGVFSRGGKYISSQRYTNHMMSCPAPSDTKTRVLLLEQLSQKAKAVLKETPVSSEQYSGVVVLRAPHRVVQGAQATINYIEQQIKDRQAISEFINRVGAGTDQAEFLTMLQADLPGVHHTLQAFQEYIREKHTINGFDTIIDQAAQRILNLNPREKDLAAVAAQAISEAMRAQTQQMHIEFPGIGRDEQEHIIVFHPHLSALLPLLALQRAYATRNDKATANILAGCTGLVDAERTAVATDARLLNRWKSAKRVAESLRTSAGITEDDLQRLTEVVNTTHIDGQNPEIVRERLYDSLFNALVSHKRGVADLNSPIFQSFFASLVGIKDVNLSSLV